MIIRIKAALEYISADCDRDTWLNVVFAIHSTGWGDAGKAIAREWSATAPELFNARDFHRDWVSANSDKSGGITISTLFKIAIDSGWSDPNWLKKTHEDYGDWYGLRILDTFYVTNYPRHKKEASWQKAFVTQTNLNKKQSIRSLNTATM